MSEQKVERVTFGQRIRAVRIERKWTQDQAVETINRASPAGARPVRASYLCHLETGRTLPSAELAVRIAKAYGLNPEELVYLARWKDKVQEMKRECPNMTKRYV